MNLVGAAATLLAVASASIVTNDLPANVYRTHDKPVIDVERCEGLTVHVADVRVLSLPSTQPSNAPLHGSAAFGSQLVVTLWRCVPVVNDDGTAPDPAALDASAVGLETDGAELFKGVVDSMLNGTLFSSCQASRVVSCLPSNQGGAGVWTLTIEIQL